MKKRQIPFTYIEKKINTKTFGVLTTINQDGTPHSTGILYGVSPPSKKFNLYFFTSKKYQKVRNIMRNPNVSLIVPFPHYFIRFAPSGTVTFNGKVSFVSTDDSQIKHIFAKKRVLRLILKEIESQNSETFTFGKISPHPKVLCHGVGYNIWELRKGHKQAGYSVNIPKERLE
jgi:general stress protein 26